jgi:cytochrome c556
MMQGMRSRRYRHGACGLGVAAAFALVVTCSAPTRAIAADEHDHEKLPPGPIRDRVDIMEGVGKNAKAIGAVLKRGESAEIAMPASEIAAAIGKFTKLFPEGSIGEGSRAKPEIWSDRAKFDELAGQLKSQAEALAAAAKSGGDVKTTSSVMWKTCKACHTEFRVPKEGE